MKQNPFDIVPDMVLGNSTWSLPVYDMRDGKKCEKAACATIEQLTGGKFNSSNSRESYLHGIDAREANSEKIKCWLLSLLQEKPRQKITATGAKFAFVRNHGVSVIFAA